MFTDVAVAQEEGNEPLLLGVAPEMSIWEVSGQWTSPGRQWGIRDREGAASASSGDTGSVPLGTLGETGGSDLTSIPLEG